MLVLDPLGELRHPGHEILDPLAQPLDLRKQLALRVLVLRLAQLLRQAGQLAPRGGQFLAELLHRVETRAVKQVLEVEDVLLLLADLRLQRAIEPAKRAVAAGRAAGQRGAGQAGAVDGGPEARRSVPERATQGLRRELVLEQLGAGGVQLLRERAGVAILLSRLRVPLRGGVRVAGRRFLFQAVAEERHQPLPQRLRADQRFAAVLGGGEHLDRLGRRDAALGPVDGVIVLRLQVVADAIPGAKAQRRDLPGVRAAKPLRRRRRGLEDGPLFLRARPLPDQRHFGQAIVVSGRPGDLHAPLRIDLQHRLLRRIDVHLRRLIGDDLDGARRTLCDGPSARVGEPQAPLAGLGEREAARELAATRPGNVELHRGAVDYGERLRQVAVGACGDPHFGAPRRPQIARRAFLGAGRQAGIRRVEVGDGKIAGDRRQLHRRRPALAGPEAQHAARDVTGRKGGDDRPDQAARDEREERPAQRRRRQDPIDVDLPRRLSCSEVQHREQLGGDAAGILAGQLDAAEQLRRPADQPREKARVPGAQRRALQR